MSGYGNTKIGTEWRGYYITAYGIAVKHGFQGTEEELSPITSALVRGSSSGC